MRHPVTSLGRLQGAEAHEHEQDARDPRRMLPALRGNLPFAPATRRAILRAWMALGALASVAYFGWWFQHGRLDHPALAVAFVVAAFYAAVQVFLAWYVYDGIAIPALPPALPGRSVDVFVPVYDESLELVEECLRAALAMRYPHRTYLLDDAQDPRLAELATRLGTGYLTRDGQRDAKAGNVNAALARTSGEFVTVFDVDHIPAPDFLDVVLGGFDDPKAACVQSGVGFHNRDDSLVSRATI